MRARFAFSQEKQISYQWFRQNETVISRKTTCVESALHRVVAHVSDYGHVLLEGFVWWRRCVISQRFKIGDRIHVIGVLASFHPGKTGVVIGVEPNPDGIRELDRYVVEIPGAKIGNTKFADFQLAPATKFRRRGATHDVR